MSASGLPIHASLDEWSGIAQMDFRNKADWQKLGASDEWKSTAGPDNANFVDTASVK